MISDSAGKPTSDAFSDLDTYTCLPRLGGLWLSPDGRRIVVGVSTPGAGKTRYVTALWEVDPDGERPARPLTHSAEGETAAAFTPSGDLLFVSARPEPGANDGPSRAALWRQPAAGGDARVVARPAGGVRGVVVSAHGAVVLGSALLPTATDPADDAEIRARREEAGVSAILHETYPIRYWDHDLGPDRTRLLAAGLSEDVTPAGSLTELQDLTGHVGGALDDDCSWDITPDGRTVVTDWVVAEPDGAQRRAVVAIDVATGERRTLADDPAADITAPRLSPDGTRIVVGYRERDEAGTPGDRWLSLLELSGGPPRHLTAGWDRWPHSARWTPDGKALVVVADDLGRAPLWRVDAGTGQVSRLTPDDGAYTDTRVSPDGRWVYALRSTLATPPAPVRVSLDGAGTVSPLPGPADSLGARAAVPGRLTEVTTTAGDGTPLRGWLALPEQAGPETPAPLLLWIHGGPLASFNAWSWRWNPWLAVAQGYAVLLPDFALSTGYGLDFVRRGWGSWGGAPYTDLMTITDAAQEREDIDASRTAAMGGSFGGYMANWMAGHTDRFRAIITHASLWNLEQFTGSTDASYAFRRMMTPEMTEAHSPHRFADGITTPMLVVHGDKDYRVPVGEGLALWWDLVSRSRAADGTMPHKFLYFPEENHWVLTPQGAKVWYSTVFAFLAHHLRDEEWRLPEHLG
ncbi:prolyl oligopeptidase family serine peptidase [Streptomyces sp. ACA25]|uniref:S9 family peptidase n=1 Tax=Streptomyces sp. ACA25 TaxID=3022596 RepID=UPI0023078DF8|nr:prolyl oligopeptidase family serine peptidase [Streptomyces sp. ACA25]MDB1090003.1 prolyl oligopeptidase family serine peptidase [Streptomyces sp. ACA25]